MTPQTPPLLSWTKKGLFCAAGDFYIDPSGAVETAIITHAHSDHARRGSRRYICAASGVGLLKVRLGAQAPVAGLPYGTKLALGRALISLHPAGHILGSAQVRVESGEEVWVASGDYKRDLDPSCEPFEVVSCGTFITEATFGTPKYVWDKTRCAGADLHAWWSANAAKGVNSVLFGYSLGKAQRILAELAPFAPRPVLIHESISAYTRCYRSEGRRLAETLELGQASGPLQGELLLIPPSALSGAGLERLGRYETAFASGWMQGAAGGRGRYAAGYDRGFALSDHADWNDLNRTIDETGATRVFLLQRASGALLRHLRKRGVDAHPAESLQPEKYALIPPCELPLFR
jgi:putative mRNA 3-end processing factor